MPPFIDFLSRSTRISGSRTSKIKFATRPKSASDRGKLGQVEAALENAIKATGQPYTSNPAKVRFTAQAGFQLTDAIGRDWQCGTFQVDSNLPERLERPTSARMARNTAPIMLHRAALDRFERFIGILIEEHAGKLPFWLAPRQVVVASIMSDADDYVHEVVDACKAQACGPRPTFATKRSTTKSVSTQSAKCR